MRPACRAPGCVEPVATRYARFCPTHKARLRRHGAVDQRRVSKGDVEPYLTRVRARIEKNSQSGAWGVLEGRWAALVEHSRVTLAAYLAGRPGSRHERLAAQEIIRLADDVSARAVFETVMALVMMLDLEPRRFRSDRSFRVQLVRRVRALTDMNYGERWDHVSGKVSRTYRELSPKAATIMGEWLIEAFGSAGLHVARLERRALEAQESERERLNRALVELE